VSFNPQNPVVTAYETYSTWFYCRKEAQTVGFNLILYQFVLLHVCFVFRKAKIKQLKIYPEKDNLN